MFNLLFNRIFKSDARQLMRYPGCLHVALIVTGLYLVFLGLRSTLGANLTYALADLSKYQDTATGFYPNEQGFSLILRMDVTQTVLAIPLTYHQLFLFAMVTLLAFLVLSPLRLGAMEMFWRVTWGERPTLQQTMLPWLTNPTRWGKSVVAEAVLQGGVRLLGLVAMVPSLLLYYYFYTHATSLNQVTTQLVLIQMLALLLAIAAGFVTFYLYSIFLPIPYCLAMHPDITLKQMFVGGMSALQGHRRSFFRFRLTFLPWLLLSQLTYRTVDIFVLPYTSLANMRYLQALATRRKNPAQEDEADLYSPF